MKIISKIMNWLYLKNNFDDSLKPITWIERFYFLSVAFIIVLIDKLETKVTIKNFRGKWSDIHFIFQSINSIFCKITNEIWKIKIIKRKKINNQYRHQLLIFIEIV